MAEGNQPGAHYSCVEGFTRMNYMVDLLEASYRLSKETVLDYIDTALVDSEIHEYMQRHSVLLRAGR